MLPKNAADAHHLLSRAGFGMNAFYRSKLPLNNKDLYALLEQESNLPFPPMSLATNRYEIIQRLRMAAYLKDGDGATMGNAGRGGLDAETRKMVQQNSREDLRKVTLAWQKEMVEGNAQLREKMALFWHGHFASRDQNIFFAQNLLNEVRSKALGNFRDLLGAVSKSATMLGYLNNKQNKKGKPNENFAREVMELFTLGRGNYTEQDIKEAARAFTGWTHLPSGQFVINPRQHDGGPKTIFGKTGNFGGDEVLDMLLENKQTAYYLTHKICRFLVHDKPEERQVRKLADVFYKSNYHTGTLLREIFTSKWFFAAENRGNIIKSPVQLFVEMQRQLPMEVSNPGVVLVLQRGLGQLLFYPPNVAGWPGGNAWIDSSSLMLRLRIPQQLKASAAPIALKLKSDDDVQMGMADAQARQEGVNGIANGPSIPRQRPAGGGGGANQFQLRTTVDWPAYTALFAEVPREQLYDALYQYLLPNVKASFPKATIEQVADASSREAYIRSVSIALMSTPEYQLS